MRRRSPPGAGSGRAVQRMQGCRSETGRERNTLITLEDNNYLVEEMIELFELREAVRKAEGLTAVKRHKRNGPSSAKLA